MSKERALDENDPMWHVDRLESQSPSFYRKDEFQTPIWVCKIMINEIDYYPSTILEPTPGKGNITRVIQKRFPKTSILSPKRDFLTMEVEKVDWIIANPPFSPMEIGYNMLYRLFEFSKNVIALMPWLTIINSEARTKRLINSGLNKIIHLPRRVFPNSRVQCCILKFTENHVENVIFKAV